uniref:Transmembrane protein 14C n=1 Tax=Sus scrofa TaxID=9823 RepID=A0A8D1QWG8_PIG
MQKDSGPLVPLHWIGFGYAALVASGGIIGYAKAGSVPSLAAGLLFGGLAGLGAYQLSQDPRNIWVFLGTSGLGWWDCAFFTSRPFYCLCQVLGKFQNGGGGLCWFLLIFMGRTWKGFLPREFRFTRHS